MVFGLRRVEDVGLIVRAISFQDFQPMLSLSTNVTNRRTDGSTTCNRNTIVHRAVKMDQSDGRMYIIYQYYILNKKL